MARKGKAAEAEVLDDSAAESPEDEAIQEGRAWYVIHTYSGYENKVKTNLEHRIQTMDAKDLIFQVVVPTEDEIEIRDGQRRTVARKIFPGYVLTHMIELREDDTESSRAWFVVRNTPGVTGFVGSGHAAGAAGAARGEAHPAPDARRSAEGEGRLRGRPEGAHRGRSVHGLPRHRG